MFTSRPKRRPGKPWSFHDDVIKWKHFPRYWLFVRGIHRWPVNSPHKGQWRGALIFSLICAWINGWVNNREAGDLRRHRAHYDVTVMSYSLSMSKTTTEISEIVLNIMTSGHWNIFSITGLRVENPPVTDGFPLRRVSNAELSSFSPRLNKLLNIQWSCWWFVTPWRWCDVTLIRRSEWVN